MKAPNRNSPSSMSGRPGCKALRQRIAGGEPLQGIHAVVAQSDNKCTIGFSGAREMVRFEASALVNHERLEPGHAAQMRGLVEGTQEMVDGEAIIAAVAIGSVAAARRNRRHEKFAVQPVAMRPIGPAIF